MLLACAGSLFAALSLRTYFHSYTPKRLYGGPYAELATAIAPELERLEPGYDSYLLGAPRMYANFPTLTYLAPSVEMTDLPEEISVALLKNLLNGSQGLIFVVIPQRAQDLAVLREAFPHGRTQSFLRPSDQRLVASLYLVP